MAGQSGKQRGPRPASQRGDFTGNLKEVLQAEHEETVEKRREELGITAERRQAIKDDGIVDMMSGAPKLEHPDLDSDDADKLDVVTDKTGIDVSEPEQPKLPQGERIGTGTTKIDVFELPEERPQAAITKDEVLTPEMLDEPTLVKVLYDLDEVTIGYGNTFTFKADYRYRVPRWVAAHLEEKGLAIVLSLSAV